MTMPRPANVNDNTPGSVNENGNDNAAPGNQNVNDNAQANANRNDNASDNGNGNVNENENGNENGNLNDNASPPDSPVDEPQGMIFSEGGTLLVASRNSAQLLEYNGQTGEFLGVFAEDERMPEPFSFAYGPDDELYVTDRTANAVVRVDGVTGAFIDIFAETGEGSFPIGIAFGDTPDVSTVAEPNTVGAGQFALTLTTVGVRGDRGEVRIEPAGGAYTSGATVELTARAARGFAFVGFTGDISDDEVEALPGQTVATIVMSADREITATYAATAVVSTFNVNALLEIHPTTGEVLDTFATGAGPIGVALSPEDGDPLIAARVNNAIYRYDLTIGAGDLFTLDDQLYSPRFMTRGPNGNLFVVVSNDPFDPDHSAEYVAEVDIVSGAFVRVFTQGDHLAEPRGLAFRADGDLFVGNRDTNNIIHFDGDTGAFVEVFIQGAPIE